MINKIRNLTNSLSYWLDDRPSDGLFCFVIIFLTAEVLIFIYMLLSLENLTLENFYHAGSLIFFLAATCLAYVEIIINRKALRINARKENISELQKNRNIVLKLKRSGINPCLYDNLNNKFVLCRQYRKQNGTLKGFKMEANISNHGTNLKNRIEKYEFSKEVRSLVRYRVEDLVDQYLDNIEFVLNYAGRMTAERLELLVEENSENPEFGTPEKILEWLDEGVHARTNKKIQAVDFFDESYNKILNYIDGEIAQYSKAIF